MDTETPTEIQSPQATTNDGDTVTSSHATPHPQVVDTNAIDDIDPLLLSDCSDVDDDSGTPTQMPTPPDHTSPTNAPTSPQTSTSSDIATNNLTSAAPTSDITSADDHIDPLLSVASRSSTYNTSKYKSRIRSAVTKLTQVAPIYSDLSYKECVYKSSNADNHEDFACFGLATNFYYPRALVDGIWLMAKSTI